MDRCVVHSPTDFGGKSRIAALVWDHFGDVPNLVEPFFGSGAVLLGRPTPPRIETVNDIDAFITNFFRALQHDPERVAHHADYFVSEVDLYARHRWLVDRRGWVEQMMTDPDVYDAKVAGWWVWGISQWIGSGWCRNSQTRHLPSLGDAGRRVHRKRPHLATAGKGLQAGRTTSYPSRQMPHLSDGGTGVHGLSRQIPLLRGGNGAGIHASAHRGGGIYAYFADLAERLRHVRVCCGDWTRVLGPSVTEKIGVTGIFLDPPYSHAERDDDLYSHDNDVAAAVRAWALANGENPMLRIALCSYDEPGSEMPGWTAVRWKANGGYGSQGNNRARANAARETVWFNKSCLRAATLFDYADEEVL